MSKSNTDIAQGVSSWENLGVELPEDLTAAIERFDALRYVEVGYQPRFDVRSVTPENAEEKVMEFASVLANHIPQQLDGVRASVLEAARSVAVDAAASHVNVEAAKAIPHIIEKLTPVFEEHAERYSEAVLKLPETINSETLVNAGADAVAAYAAARQEAAEINRYATWVDQTSELPTGQYGRYAGFLGVLRPEEPLQLVELDNVSARVGNMDRTFAALNPVYFTAVRLGVPFKLNTLREATALRRDLGLPTNPSKLVLGVK